ncbi:GIY-YIG nuclease family protein [Pseudomonas abietaniphila]|uniref:GIY-YIG nuclease family protein n=1 Tax=Pseudomonas abietaniphila TaxID=89065 RepID=UPI0032169368
MLEKLLGSVFPQFDPKHTKIHLACFNGKVDPLDVYLDGKFDYWQSWQMQRNFQRKYLISVIQMPNPKHWLFVGAYDSFKATPISDPSTKCKFRYTFNRLEEFKELEGRLIINFHRTDRPSYRLLHNCIDRMSISQILPSPLTIGPFPGFKSVEISFRELKIIARENIQSWEAALSSVAGVYLISDREHQMLYVGSATGESGLWGRWCEYAKGGHGGNKRLKALRDEKGTIFTDGFHFSILEIADKHTGKEQMLERENDWKRRLLTRDSGLNGN